MELELFRDASANGCTLGRLSINGVFSVYTLEPPIADAEVIAIPQGTYPVTIGWSAHFERMVPHVNNVPDRTEIEIHFGNYVTNTKGCILVGEQKEQTMILNSMAAFNLLFEKLREAAIKEAISIRVINPEVTQ